MNLKHSLLLPLLALGAACSGGSSSADSTTTFESAADAYEAGLKALNESNYAAAQNAFLQVVDDTSVRPETRLDALMGLGEAYSNTNASNAAATFERAQSEFAEFFDEQMTRRMVDAYINGGALDEARAAIAAHKEMDFDKAIKAIQAKESGDTAALEELGYAGD